LIRINLIPPEYAEAQSKKDMQVMMSVFGVIVISIMAAILLAKKYEAQDYQKKIVKAENTLQKYQAIIDKITEIDAKKQKLVAKRDVIVNLNRSRLIFPVFFEDLLPLIPSDVWVTDIRLEKQMGNNYDYRMSSKALSNFALATWLTNLEQSSNFQNVKIDRISYESSAADKDTAPALNFTLTFSYQHQGPMPLSEMN